MKKLFIVFIILISLSFSYKAQAQRYDLTCPIGTQPFTPMVTNNPQTGNLKANACIDSTGTVTYQGSSGGTLTLPSGIDIGGVTNAYIVNPNPTITLTQGTSFSWTTTRANTGATTINVSGTGVQALTDYRGSALTGAEIGTGITYTSTYDGTSWKTINTRTGNASTLSASSSSAQLTGPVLISTKVPTNGGNTQIPSFVIVGPSLTTPTNNRPLFAISEIDGTGIGCWGFGPDGDNFFIFSSDCGSAFAFVTPLTTFQPVTMQDNTGNNNHTLLALNANTPQVGGHFFTYANSGNFLFGIDSISGAPTAGNVAAGTSLNPTLSGTGACATISTQRGGAWAGSFVCTAAAGASTVTITPGGTGANGWTCTGNDITDGLSLAQSASTTTTCTLKVTTVAASPTLNFIATKW